MLCESLIIQYKLELEKLSNWFNHQQQYLFRLIWNLSSKTENENLVQLNKDYENIIEQYKKRDKQMAIQDEENRIIGNSRIARNQNRSKKTRDTLKNLL